MYEQIRVIEEKIKDLLQAEPDSFLVEIKISAGNNVKVFVDADQGMSLERLIKYNRQLYKQIEEGGIFPNNDFSLEVSSPGLDEPLKLHRQYLKNIGRHVEVIQKDGAKIEGKLLNAEKDLITLEEEKGKKSHGRQTGKKKEIIEHIIPLENIKSTKIQIKF